MRLLGLVFEFHVLLALVPVMKLQCLNKLRTVRSVDEEHRPAVNLPKQKLLDRAKAWFEVIRWRTIDLKTQAAKRIEWRLFGDLPFVLTGGVRNHEAAESRKVVEHEWAQCAGCKLFDPHVYGSSFVEDEETTAIIHLCYEAGWRAAEMLPDHQGEAWNRLERDVRDMGVGFATGRHYIMTRHGLAGF